jgi:tRNA nucleotidyltransferase (CCA-adding enzyme)
MIIPKILKKISKTITKKGGKAIVVGGSVRDYFLGIEAKDFDIEVFGLKRLEDLEAILAEYGRVELVGKSFGVLKFIYQKQVYDFSFPRKETKVAAGHKGFCVEVDGTFSYEVAARRRDFTINAMGYNIEQKTFLDPFGGRKDIAQKRLRHIDDKTFIEDPLRIYRGVQFAARFAYSMAEETKTLCTIMIEQGVLEELPKERVYEEFKKLLLKAKKPSIGFELMRELDILRYYPELKALIGVAQDPKWHPEGDVWTHTMMAIDAMARLLRGDEKRDLMLMYAELCHDFGKPSTTKVIDGRIRALGHERAGLAPTQSFMSRLSNEQDFIDKILPLVNYHLSPSMLYHDKSSKAAIRRLSTKVNIADLVLVAKADFLGRTTKEALRGEYLAGEWLLEMAKSLDVVNAAPKMLLQGRDLIALGLKPSREFKKILDRVYEMQLEGEIKSHKEAVEVAKTLI